MGSDGDKRRHDAHRSLIAWYCTAPVAVALSVLAALEAWRAGEPWGAILLVFVTAISVWAGIEAAHARINADLPTEAD